MKKIVLKSIIIYIFIFLLTTLLYAGGLYKWVDGEGNVHFSNGAVPQEYKEKMDVLRGTKKLVGNSIKVPKIGISLIKFEMKWYLSKSSLQKEGLYQPEIRFSVKNISDKAIEDLKFKAVFLEDNNRIFGRDTEYVEGLKPNYTSETVFMRTGMGLVYNGYNKDTIMNRKFTVELYVFYKREEILIKRIPFYSDVSI